MRRRYNGYGVRQSYADYGLSKETAEELLKECRAGKYNAQVQKAARKAAPCIAQWLALSIMGGKSYADMEIEQELKGETVPYCRNSFYSYRKLTLVILDKMLSEEQAV